MTLDLPKKIKPDAILEALIELRFESTEIPEMAIGRVYTTSTFGRFDKVRLPQADIPPSAREADENLRYQPMYQLQSAGELVRFGSNMFSHHILKPYGGWDAFRPKIEASLSECLKIWNNPTVERISLRYINALSIEEHGISGMRDLNLSISVNDDKIDNVLVNFATQVGDDFELIVRAAARGLVQGDIPPETTTVIDIEVRPKSNRVPQDLVGVMNWIDEAHNIEKKQFFALIPTSIVRSLTEG